VAVIDPIVIKITSDTKGVQKTIDLLEKSGDVEKKNVKIFEEAAKKRQFLLDRNIKRLEKLKVERQKAFNPKDIRRFDERIKKTTSDIELLGGKLKVVSAQSTKFGATLGKLGTILVGAFAVGAIVNFTKHLFEVAVEAEAFRKRAQVVFGDSIEIVEKFARKSSISLGFTEDAFLGAAAAIGDILVPLGISRQRAAEMSVEAVRLGSVLKEFTGDQRSAAEISNIVAKAFTGEVESLKGLGIVVNQNDAVFKDLIKTKIRDLGLTKAQAKAEAIFETVLLSSADALASFETNADSLTRQQAELNAQSEELADTLAHLLTPAFVGVTTEMNKQVKTVRDIIDADESLFKTIIALITPNSKYALVLKLQGIALRAIAEASEEATEEHEENTEALKEQIRNVFFLKDAISVLRKEQQAQGTTIQRVAQIQRELIPLQKELNDLLGKPKALTPLQQLVKKIADLQKELQNQALSGNIARESLEEYEAAVRELADAQIELELALKGTLQPIEAQRLELDKISTSTKTATQLIREFEEIQRDEIEKTTQKRLTALNRIGAAENQISRIIAQNNLNQLIAIDNLETKELRALQKQGLGEEELADRQQKIREESDRRRAEILTKQAVADKNAALIQAAINTAVEVTKVISNIPLAVIVAALGAAEIAVIAAQPIPEFHEGKKSELKSGEISAVILESESVIPPKASAKNKGLIDSIIDDNLTEYVFKHYQLPILKQMSSTGNIFDDRNITGKQSKTNRLLAESNALTRDMIKTFGNSNHRRSWN